nr:PAP2 superfamily [uncultured bacterium]
MITGVADTVLFPAMLLMLSVLRPLCHCCSVTGCLHGTIFLWAALTAYTRVYLGVHFISDIVPGAIAGVFFGWLVYWLYVKVRPVVTGTSSNACELYSTGQKRLIVYAIFIAVLIIAVFNVQLVACLR